MHGQSHTKNKRGKYLKSISLIKICEFDGFLYNFEKHFKLVSKIVWSALQFKPLLDISLLSSFCSLGVKYAKYTCFC